tara:strand:+ start:17 stop:610 length:594 start_codon:yes stop_codon:yes gene_type:complete
MVSEELINARAILEGSIIRSAQCFSEMINSRVHIEDLSIVFDSAMLNLSNQNHGEGSILLKTEIAGAIGGINYAIYSKEEVKLLCGQVLDGNLEKSQYYEFMIGFLKEVENVLAAAVVTEIANHLDEPIFGDVPKIEAVSVDGIMEVIEKETGPLKPNTVISCGFSIPSVNISPRIVWFFNDSLVNAIIKEKSQKVA